MNTFFSAAYPTFAPASHPFFGVAAQLHQTYANPLQQSAQEWWTSSVRIVQEQTVKAVVEASQQCFAALAQNAADLNQRTFFRLCDAHQEAFTLMTGVWTSAFVPQIRPAYP